MTGATSQARVPKTERGQRTRAKLLEAGAAVLEELPYVQVRLEDIAIKANTPISLFYHYFTDKKGFYLELIEDWADAYFLDMDATLMSALDGMSDSAGIDDFFELILVITHRQTMEFANRPGIFRCVLQSKDTEPEFSNAYRERMKASSDRHIQRLKHTMAGVELDRGLRAGLVYAANSLTDRFLFSAYCTPYDDIRDCCPDPADLSRLMALGVLRMLYLANPSKAQMGRYAGMSAFDLEPTRPIQPLPPRSYHRRGKS